MNDWARVSHLFRAGSSYCGGCRYSRVYTQRLEAGGRPVTQIERDCSLGERDRDKPDDCPALEAEKEKEE